MSQAVLAEVFTADEVARAAGVSRRAVQALLAAGEVHPIAGTAYIPGAEAVRIGRRLKTDGPQAVVSRKMTVGAVASSAVHALLAAAAIWISAGAADMEAVEEPPATPTRLVFIMTPGPGGGGGGGGLRNPLPAARAQRRGPERRRVSVPPVVRNVAPPPTPIERPPEPLPTRVINAPVVAAAADPRDADGVVERGQEAAASQGPGADAGAGTGRGAGSGEGFGSGIGDGAGGGAGGGPYRPGSGIEPPRLVREVKAVYTEDARRRGLTGDVLLEIVVRSDGSVGDVSVVRGLGAGLEQRAIDAVRQWRFAPARRRGVPVDVIVEVAVEFTLR